jgi:hypothetical protein
MPTKKALPAPAIDEQEHQDPEETLEDSGDYEADAPSRLTGVELLEFYDTKKAAGRTHGQIAYDAGYYTVTKANRERVLTAQFNEAILEAQGIETGGRASGPGRSHAGLTVARVSGQGIMLVSQLATRNVGANPGDLFSVTYPGDGVIVLTPTGETKPVVARKPKGEAKEEPGTPLLDQPV